jgi:hypothetical protein
LSSSQRVRCRRTGSSVPRTCFRFAPEAIEAHHGCDRPRDPKHGAASASPAGRRFPRARRGRPRPRRPRRTS